MICYWNCLLNLLSSYWVLMVLLRIIWISFMIFYNYVLNCFMDQFCQKISYETLYFNFILFKMMCLLSSNLLSCISNFLSTKFLVSIIKLLSYRILVESSYCLLSICLKISIYLPEGSLVTIFYNYSSFIDYQDVIIFN